MPVRVDGRASEPVTIAAMSSSPASVRLRQIAEADLPAIAKLLSEGFQNRTTDYWLRGLRRHVMRPRPADYPTYGFCLDSGGEPVGVILLLFSNMPSADGIRVRCNVSSWYVRPAFRGYGSLLVTSTTRDKRVTYFNITPAPHTWSTVEAQGFLVYCKGQMYGIPVLSRARPASVMPFSDQALRMRAEDVDLLRQHAGFGCLSVVVRDADVDHPFVFQKHYVKGLVPVYRLLYCRSTNDFVRYAGNLGRFLLRRGGLLVRFDANEAAPMAGWFSDARGRKYAKGPHAPQLGDLAFTEAALFDS
jgi:hypothetical protein